MAEFQSLNVVKNLHVGESLTIGDGNLEFALKNHIHKADDITGLNKYIFDQLHTDQSLTVLNSLKLNGLDSSNFITTTKPVYLQMNQNISQIAEFVPQTKDLFIQLTDGSFLEKEANVFLNNKNITYMKESGDIYFGENTKIKSFDDVQLLTEKNNNYKYLYIKQRNYNTIMINSLPVIRAFKNNDMTLDLDHFLVHKSISFKSMDLFKTNEESLPIPFTVGTNIKLNLKLYSRINKENLKYVMLPEENFALVFLYGKENEEIKIGMLYLDKLKIAYKYNLPENFAELNEIEEINSFMVEPGESFTNILKSVYLFRPNNINIKINKFIGCKPTEIKSLTSEIREAVIDDVQKDILVGLKNLLQLNDSSVENNKALANILQAKETTINGVTFKPGDNITVTAVATGGNADTLNNLNSNNFVMTKDVSDNNTEGGKIAKFDKDGHLVYPDGHSEWVE